MTYDLTRLLTLDPAVSASSSPAILEGVATSEFEAYRADLDTFLPVANRGDTLGIALPHSAEDFFSRAFASGRGRTLALFARWMRDQHRGPWANTATPAGLDFAAIGALLVERNRGDGWRVRTDSTDRNLVALINPEVFERYRDTYPRFVASGVGGADNDYSFDDLLRYIRSGDIGPVNVTLPTFLHWLADQPEATVPQGSTTPVFDVNMTPAALWADHVRLLTSIRDLWLEWAAQSQYSTSTDWAAFMHDGTTGDVAYWNSRSDAWVQPGRYLDLFLTWLRQPENASRVPTVPQGNSVAAPSLPTSPKDAFPTWDEAYAAAQAWETDRDPRLPNERSTGTSTYNRDRGHSRSYAHEMRTQWNADRFDANPRSYSDGFWRDVRTLGYGTPYWVATGKDRTPAVLADGTTAIPIGPDHPGWNQWWLELDRARGGRYRGEFERMARAMGGPIDPEQAIRDANRPAVRQHTITFTWASDRVMSEEDIRRGLRDVGYTGADVVAYSVSNVPTAVDF